MHTEIGIKVKEISLCGGDLVIESERGDRIYLVGKNDWVNLISKNRQPYKKKMEEMLERVDLYRKGANSFYHKRAKAVYVGMSQMESLRIGGGYTNSWDKILGVPLFLVDKDDYFDISFE